MSASARVAAGVPAGGQFAAAGRGEPGLRLAVRIDVEQERRFAADLAECARRYRSAATYRDDDHIGSANLVYLASWVAEETEDETNALIVEDASDAMAVDPGDRFARDACARIVTAFVRSRAARARAASTLFESAP